MSKEKKWLSAEKKQGMLDVIYSIGAIGVFNMVLQLVLYPYLQRQLGADRYGVVLSALSIISVTAGTLGISANYSRMVSQKSLNPTNGDYNILMLLCSVLCAAIGVGYLYYLGIGTPLTAILFAVLTVLTAFRYYSDVDFRMRSNFKHFLIYYLMISVGYLLGMGVFLLSGEWMTALIVGEALGILFAVIVGKIYRKPLWKKSAAFGAVSASLGLLIFSNLIENLTLNADRLLLISFADGTAVSTYYTASLLGKVIAMLTMPINSLIISYLVKLDCKLTKKFWSVALCGVCALGLLAFIGCTVMSPLVLKILYRDLYAVAKPYIIPAILGQIVYFISGMLLVILLKFRGEKKQFFFNVIYCIEYFALTVVCTLLWGLNGFVWSSLAGNAIRFVLILIWGFHTAEKKAEQAKETADEP